MNLFKDCTGKTLLHGMTWLNEPPDWSFDSAGRLTIVPQGVTDFFRPYSDKPNDNACLLYKEVTGDFTAVTRTRAELAGFGDATALTIRSSETLWAKICLERSPIGDISVVSVVTKVWSDDSNGELLKTPECFLRVTRKGNLFGMHYSLDGAIWRFIRYFSLEVPPTVMVGVHAQAPFQAGCKGYFDRLELTAEPVKDFRSGE